MASTKTPKERKFVSASKPSTEGKTPKGRATGRRIGAVVLWLVAIAIEVAVIALLNGILFIEFDMMYVLIGGIGLDLVCVIIGALLWKKANRIDPASQKNKLKFFLWNNMGVIAAVIAFLPLIVILLKNKELDEKTKKIVTVVAAIALVVAGAVAYDWNPVSAETLSELQAEIGDDTVYWTRWGRVYHLDEDCHTITRSSTIFYGSIEEAVEANRHDPCYYCAQGN